MSSVVSNVGCKEPQSFVLLITISILLWKSHCFHTLKNCTINNLKKCFSLLLLQELLIIMQVFQQLFSFNQRKIVFTIVCSYCSTKSHFPLSRSHRRGNTRRVPSCCPTLHLKTMSKFFFFFLNRPITFCGPFSIYVTQQMDTKHNCSKRKTNTRQVHSISYSDCKRPVANSL